MLSVIQLIGLTRLSERILHSRQRELTIYKKQFQQVTSFTESVNDEENYDQASQAILRKPERKPRNL